MNSTVMLILYISLMVLVAILILTPKSFVVLDPWQAETDKCQKFYGKGYVYVNGDRSPDLCVTKDGKVRYYHLIK